MVEEGGFIHFIEVLPRELFAECIQLVCLRNYRWGKAFLLVQMYWLSCPDCGSSQNTTIKFVGLFQDISSGGYFIHHGNLFFLKLELHTWWQRRAHQIQNLLHGFWLQCLKMGKVGEWMGIIPLVNVEFRKNGLEVQRPWCEMQVRWREIMFPFETKQ